MCPPNSIKKKKLAKEFWTEEGCYITELLNDAKSHGYAESDPSFDINGMDTAHKLSIMSSISFNNKIDLDKVYVSGIEDIQYTDLKYADELGFKISKRVPDGIREIKRIIQENLIRDPEDQKYYNIPHGR